MKDVKDEYVVVGEATTLRPMMKKAGGRDNDDERALEIGGVDEFEGE